MISSIHQSISALNAFGRKMEVKSNNLANVNTVGFKAGDSNFQDLPSQSIASASGTGQVGRGTAVSHISTSFSQGSFEATGNSTNMAIGGDGFFILREAGSDDTLYSRAGSFHFDADGFLVNPEGYVVQGWELDENGNNIGDIQDIQMQSFSSPPRETTEMRMILNLDATASGHGGSLEASWDGTLATASAMGDNSHEYRSTLSVHDALGDSHDVTVYFDKVSGSQWEYVVTCNPGEDARPGASGRCAGLLARGTMTFNGSSGNVSPTEGITMETFNGTDWSDPTNAANWSSTAPNASGHLAFSPDFLGTGTAPGAVSLDFGTRFNGTSWENESLTTTQFSRSSTTVFQSADGYAAGDFEGISVDVNGVMEGRYSNGESIPLFRVAEARFVNPQGLMKEGGNLYRETRQSGEVATGIPGTNGLGRIAPQSLEMSNVDIAKEITDTIPLQRGYEANLTVIKTKDEMLGSLLDILG